MPTDHMDATRATLRESVKELSRDEARLAGELEQAKARRRAVEKALKTLEGPIKPRKRRTSRASTPASA